ncbi:hypothetical protein AAMO2058_001033100 [Amorphochlora amoebiformis]
MKREGLANIKSYTEDDMISLYPALRTALSSVTRERDTIYYLSQSLFLSFSRCTRPSNALVSSGFHGEALGVWWRANRDKCHYLWVIEEDVGITGSIVAMIQEYDGNDSDLLAYGITNILPGWYFEGVALPKFRYRISGNPRFNTREHVQRLSNRLLEAIDDWSSFGALTWSEESIPTICVAEGYLCSDLSLEHIGQPFMWDGKIAPLEFEKRWKEDLMEAEERMRHKKQKKEGLGRGQITTPSESPDTRQDTCNIPIDNKRDKSIGHTQANPAHSAINCEDVPQLSQHWIGKFYHAFRH